MMLRRIAGAVVFSVLLLLSTSFHGCGSSTGVTVGVGVYVPGGWVGAGPHAAYPPTVIGRPPVYY
jgi:hypothetical protein